MVPMIRIMHKAGWKLRVHLCDQHLEEKWGLTWKEAELVLPPSVSVLHDNFSADRLANLFRLGVNLTCMWKHVKPDAVIVYGDRLDALIGAIAAHQLQIPVAHLQAGDTSGCIDDETRNAVSSLSTWLFAPTEHAVDKLEYSTSDEQHVYCVGDHHIDAIVNSSIEPLFFKGLQPYLVVHMHSDTKRSEDDNLSLAAMLNDALHTVGMRFVLVRPCNDLLHETMLCLQANSLCLPHSQYISLLLNSAGLVGNTSAVCIDAPFLQVKSLCIGHRQKGRGECFFETAREGKIVEGIQDMLSWPKPHKYLARGTGEAGLKTFNILNGIIA